MKDRQFMVMLALVVAAGLVLGLIAFRMSAGGAGQTTVAANGSAAAPVGGGPHPSAADAESVQLSDSATTSPDAATSNGEPTVPAKEPPELQGPTNGDPPGTAAEPSTTVETASEAVQ